jgi:hypothetical protein
MSEFKRGFDHRDACVLDKWNERQGEKRPKENTHCDKSGNRSHIFVNQLHRVVDQFGIGNIAFIRLGFGQSTVKVRKIAHIYTFAFTPNSFPTCAVTSSAFLEALKERE